VSTDSSPRTVVHVGLADTEDEGATNLRNVSNYLPVDKRNIPEDLNLQSIITDLPGYSV
jgi:hypothetical protein